MKKFPYFLIIAALYPVISLYALNISEINITNVFRPLIFSLICIGSLFGVLVLVLRDKQKAAIVATILFLVFSSYGAFYNVTKGFSIGKAVIGSHRVLLPFVTILTLIIVWLVIKRMRPPYSNVIQGFNFGAIRPAGLSARPDRHAIQLCKTACANDQQGCCDPFADER